MVLFDAGGTLLRPHPSQEEVTARVLTEAGIDVAGDPLVEAIRAANARLFGGHGRDAQRWASESAIRDTDFAAETSQLTRNQILVSAGTSVLALANSTPQSVLSLLQGR